MEKFLPIPGIIAIVLVLVLKLDLALQALFLLIVPLNWLSLMHIGPLSALDLAAIGIPLILLVKTFFSGKNILYEFNKDPTIQLFYIMIFLLLLAGLSPIRTVPINYEKAIQDWAKFATGFLIFFILSTNITSIEKADRLISIIPFSLFLPIIIFFWQLLTGIDCVKIHHGTHIVPNAYFNNPHIIAYAIAMILPTVYYSILVSQSNVKKLLWISILCLMLLVVFFSYARTAWLGVLAELIMIMLLSSQKRITLPIFSIIILIISPLIYNAFSSNLMDIVTFFSNIPDVFYTNYYDYLFSGRWLIFRRSLLGIYSGNLINILLGYGIGGTGFLTAGLSYGAGHNTYITLLCDFGLINTLIFLSLLFLIFLRALRLMQTSNYYLSSTGKMCLITITGYLVIGLGTHFIYFMISGIWLFWGLCGVMIGLYSNMIRSSSTM